MFSIFKELKKKDIFIQFLWKKWIFTQFLQIKLIKLYEKNIILCQK